MHDAHDQGGKSVIVLGGFADDFSHGRCVVMLHAAAERVGEQLFRRGLYEQLWSLQNCILQFAGAVERRTIGQLAAGNHWLASLGCAPAAGGVEVIKGETDWIHEIVAGRAGGLLAMPGDLLAE